MQVEIVVFDHPPEAFDKNKYYPSPDPGRFKRICKTPAGNKDKKLLFAPPSMSSRSLYVNNYINTTCWTASNSAENPCVGYVLHLLLGQGHPAKLGQTGKSGSRTDDNPYWVGPI
jgi:hypothetical protein